MSVALSDYAPLASSPAKRTRGNEETIARAVEMVAVRFVRTWGFTTVDMVSHRFRLTMAPTGSRSVMAREALTRLSDLRWLDPARQWFTLIGRESPMQAALAKVVAVSGCIDRDDILLALGKHHSFGQAPNGVVRAYVAELVGSQAWARPSGGGPTSASALTREERVLVDLLRCTGGSATTELLRHEAARHSIAPEALKRVLWRSPLFLRMARGSYRLVGTYAPIAPRTLLTSGRWETSV